MEKVFKHQQRIAYTHCTVGNHVYYARYWDLLEIVRGEFCRELGWTLLDLQNEGLIFPVVECSMRYRSAARYDDVLQTDVWLTQLGRIRVGFGYRCRVGEKVICEAESLHACTNLEDKPTRIPEKVMQALGAYLKPAPTS